MMTDYLDKRIRIYYTHDGYNATMGGKHVPFSSSVEFIPEQVEPMKSIGAVKYTGQWQTLVFLNGSKVLPEDLKDQQKIENALVVFDHPSNAGKLTVVWTNIFGLRGAEYSLRVNNIEVLEEF